jgi:hypothetical protein
MLMSKYFWFVCAAVWAVILLIQRVRLRGRVDTGELRANEVKQFFRRALVAIATPCLLLGLLQLTGGYDSPEFLVTGDGRPPATLSWVVIVTSWVLLLRLVWSRSGLEYFATYAGVFYLPTNPLTLRIVVTAAVVVSALGALAQAGG